MSRRINLNDYPLAHPPLMEWVRANGLTPYTLPLHQEVLVENGHITVSKFVLQPNGMKTIADDGMNAVTEVATVPLISPLENHGL